MSVLIRWRLEFALFGLFITYLYPQSAGAQCTSLTNPNSTVVGDQIYFQAGAGVDSSLIGGAIGQWSSGCSGSMGSDFPNLAVGSNPNTLTYTVVMGGDSPGSGCANLQGATITLYASATDGISRFDCGSQTLNLAHEMGHVLGLADSPNTSSCQFHIMANVNRNNGYSRFVQGDECNQVDFKWKTSAEKNGSDTGGGGNPCV